MDQALKQRLVGATILIALAVIFLPLLLDGENRDGQATQPIEIPERPDVDFKTRRLPIGDHGQPQVEQQTEQEIPAKQQPASSKPIELTEKVEFKEPEIEESPPIQQVSGGDWLVQVGSFGSLDNANRVGKELDELGFAAMLEATGSNPDSLVRVKIGPFKSAAEASQAAERVSNAIPGINPSVVSKGGVPVAETTSLTGWVVQLGSFSASENAAKLSAQLNQQGFNVYTDTADTAGKAVFKVRTDPVNDRAAAEKLRDRIKAQTNITGIVVKLAER